jgi:hypothetical protein
MTRTDLSGFLTVASVGSVTSLNSASVRGSSSFRFFLNGHDHRGRLHAPYQNCHASPCVAPKNDVQRHGICRG